MYLYFRAPSLKVHHFVLHVRKTYLISPTVQLVSPTFKDGTSISLAVSFEGGNMELTGSFSLQLALAKNAAPGQF